jgi:hypothetical protein
MSMRNHPRQPDSGARVSRGPASSRAAREKAELALTPAERLTLALELSDLCAELAAAGRRALKERS